LDEILFPDDAPKESGLRRGLGEGDGGDELTDVEIVLGNGPDPLEIDAQGVGRRDRTLEGQGAGGVMMLRGERRQHGPMVVLGLVEIVDGGAAVLFAPDLMTALQERDRVHRRASDSSSGRDRRLIPPDLPPNSACLI
jgi:hypothetical protein